MDIKELENFNLADAVKFHDELNPALWTDKGRLDPEVHDRLMDIAKDFMTYLGLSSLKVEDITISGSNAAYSYTPHSDLDLHILVDFDKLPDDKVYRELFNAKKTIYNDKHDIKVHGVPVELYVQDSNQLHHSLGEYSILKKDWIKMPIKRRANFDQSATRAKYEKLGELIELAIKTRSLKRVDKALDIVKRYRKAGLEKTGEFGPENLAFKAIRKQGLFKELWDLKNELRSEELSLEEYHQEHFKQDVNEMPLPADWDAEQLNLRQTFKNRLKYALDRAKRLGGGSSRVAMTIDYEGRPTVLKVAKNAKGLAQNEAEVEILEDGYSGRLPIVIPLIDYDKANKRPVWLQTELAKQVRGDTLQKLLHTPTMYLFMNQVRNLVGKKGPYDMDDKKIKEVYFMGTNIKFKPTEQDYMIFRTYAEELAELAMSSTIELGDFGNPSNWGIYNNRPVVLDLGFTEDTAQLYKR